MYDYNTGIAKILYESEKNDMAIFEAIILTDMTNVSKSKTLQEAELITLQEEATKGFFTKIAEFLEGLAKKIGEVVNTFIDRLNMFLMRDNVSLVTYYNERLNNKDLSNFKYKIRERTQLHIDDSNILNLYEDEASNLFTNIDSDDASGIRKALETLTANDEFILKLLKSTVNTNKDNIKSAREYKSTVFDMAFYKEKEIVGLKQHDRDLYTAKLIYGNNKQLKDLKRIKDNSINKLHALSKQYRMKDNNTSKDMQYKANAQYELLRITERAYLETFSVFMQIIKFDVKQCRSIFEQAVLYRSTESKEEPTNETFSLQEYYGNVLMDEEI